MAQTYKQYLKSIKKLGAKQIATPTEHIEIEKRLGRQRILRRARERTERRAALRDIKPTVRTRAIEKSLRRGGLTQKEIARLRGK